METATSIPEVVTNYTPEQQEAADTLFSYLQENSSREINETLQGVLNESEMAAALKAMEQHLAEGRYARSVYVGGTGSAKEGAGLEGEDAQVAVGILKSTGRIFQVGRGRGKGIILLGTSARGRRITAAANEEMPIARKTVLKPRVQRNAPPTDAFAEVATAMNDAVQKMTDVARDAVTAANKRADELTEVLAEREREITELKSQLSTRQAQTW